MTRRGWLLPGGWRSLSLDLLLCATLIGALVSLFVLDFLHPPPPPDLPDTIARPGDPGPKGEKHKVLIIMVDALRADLAFDRDRLPVVSELCDRGACGIAQGPQVSLTILGILAVGTGQTDDLVWGFQDFAPTPYPGPNLMRSVRSSGGRTGLFGDDTWSGLFGADFSITAARSGLPRWLYYREAVYGVDALHYARARYHIKRHQPDLSVIHFVGVDHTGHRFGTKGPEMDRQLRQLDAHVRGLMEVVEPGTLIALCSDHGTAATGNHSGADPAARRTPFVLVGPGIRHVGGLRVDQRDWSTLLAELLDVPIPGHSLGILPVEALDEALETTADRVLRNAWSLLRLREAMARIAPGFAAYLPGTAAVEQAEARLRAGDANAAIHTALRWMRALRTAWSRAAARSRVSFLAVTSLFVLLLGWFLVRATRGMEVAGGASPWSSWWLPMLPLALAMAVAAALIAPPEPVPLGPVGELPGLVTLGAALLLLAPAWLMRRRLAAAARIHPVTLALLAAVPFVFLHNSFVLPGLGLTLALAAGMLATTGERRRDLLLMGFAWLLLAAAAIDYRGELTGARGDLGLATLPGDVAGAVLATALGLWRVAGALRRRDPRIGRAVRAAVAALALFGLGAAITVALQPFEVRRTHLTYLPVEAAGATLVILILARRSRNLRGLLPVLAMSVWMAFAVRGQILGMAAFWVAAEALGRTRLVRGAGPAGLVGLAGLLVLSRFALLSLFAGHIGMDWVEIPVALMGNPETGEVLGIVHVQLKEAMPWLMVFGILWPRLPAGHAPRMIRFMAVFLLARVLAICVQLLLLDPAAVPPYAIGERVSFVGSFLASLFLVALIAGATVQATPPPPRSSPAPGA